MANLKDPPKLQEWSKEKEDFGSLDEFMTQNITCPSHFHQGAVPPHFRLVLYLNQLAISCLKDKSSEPALRKGRLKWCSFETEDQGRNTNANIVHMVYCQRAWTEKEIAYWKNLAPLQRILLSDELVPFHWAGSNVPVIPITILNIGPEQRKVFINTNRLRWLYDPTIVVRGQNFYWYDSVQDCLDDLFPKTRSNEIFKAASEGTASNSIRRTFQKSSFSSKYLVSSENAAQTLLQKMYNTYWEGKRKWGEANEALHCNKVHPELASS